MGKGDRGEGKRKRMEREERQEAIKPRRREGGA